MIYEYTYSSHEAEFCMWLYGCGSIVAACFRGNVEFSDLVPVSTNSEKTTIGKV
jgi:hypothetical protein